VSSDGPSDRLIPGIGRASAVPVSLYVCLVLSGAAGLVYEIVWTRMLGLIFGHTVFAITTVLAAFMAGLALGAALLGRLVDRTGRPLLVYGLLEGGIGLYALAVPVLLAYAQHLHLTSYRAFAFALPALIAAQFAVTFLILVVPTAFMGGTLPVIGRFLVTRLETLGRKVADIYAFNTFGAVLGAAAAGFVLLPAIGVRSTVVLAAAVNLAVGIWALTADRRGGKSSNVSVTPSACPDPSVSCPTSMGPPSPLWLVLSAIALSGAASMAYEITWTRALGLVIGSSIYAFSAMLTTFLVGLALGSFLFARIWGNRAVSASLFGFLEIGVGFTALLLVPAPERMPDLVLMIMRRLSPSAGTALLTQFSLSFLAMILPTTLLGATVPCAIQLCARRLARLGRDIGRVYSANTVGTIAGALLAGFGLIPWLGVQATMIVGSAVNVAIGGAILLASAAGTPAWRRPAIVSIVVLFAVGVTLVPRWDPRVMTGGVSIYAQRFTHDADPVRRFRQDAAAQQLLFYREGIDSTVAVERTARTMSLRVDGKVDASNGLDMPTQLMLGHLPVLLHPRPERVLVIGLGSGVTVGAVAQHPAVRQIDVVELEEAVAEASRFFVEENRHALQDPRVRLVIGDARNFILAATKRYDAISAEPSNPWMAGVANLFSRDFYRLARERLADGGIMVQWLHGYSLFPRELKMIVATFRRVFPHTTLWRTISGDYLLVGTPAPLAVDYALLEQRMGGPGAVREDMTSLGLDSPVDLLTLFFVDEAGLARFAAGAPENTDDRPLLEFAAPLALYAETTEGNSRSLREARLTEFPTVRNLPAGLLESRRLHWARAYWARGEREQALEQLHKAPPPAAEDTAAWLERARLRFSLGDVAGAAEEFARLADRRPSDRLVGSYLKAGVILRRLGVQDALGQHGRTRFGNPNPAEAHNNLGVFYTRLGIRFGEPAFFDLAVDALEAARRIEPQAYQVINNLGNAYFELGRFDAAASAYREAIRLAPAEARARFNLGLVYEKQGKLDLARREFEAASALQPAWGLPKMRLDQIRAHEPGQR
jgi:spermidine synthase